MSNIPTDKRFDQFRLQAHLLLDKAAKLPGLSDLQRVQVRAAAGISGLILHRIIGQADDKDARALIDDLEAICRVVDPLVLVIGEEAQSNFGGVDLSLFRAQLMTALDGNATYELESAAERVIEDREEIESDAQRAKGLFGVVA